MIVTKPDALVLDMDGTLWDAVDTSYKPLIETDIDADWKTDILASLSLNN